MSSSVPGSARVLHVDDDPQLLDLAATLLERERESVTVETATSASEGLDCLDEGTVDCVVSDYDMPGMNGLEFLGAVREEYPDLPFILFTGKGSEEIASEAITAGVTDYLNKGSGTDQYTLLANRIENAASQYRTERDLQRSTERLQKLYGALTDAIFVLNEDWEFTHLNSQAEEILERTEAELIGENVWEQFEEAVDTTFQDQYEKAMNERVPVEFETFYPPLDVWVEVRAVPIGDGLTAHFRDISEKKEREWRTQRQNERLQTIVENAPVVLFALDDEGVFTLSEGRGLDQLGVESGSLVGESVFDVYAETGIPEDARRALDSEAVHSTVEVGERIFEAWYRPVENGDGAGSRVIGVAIDNTDRVESGRELREGRAFIQSVFDAIPDVLYAFDEERTMLQWNDQLSAVTGYSDAEIADMTPLDFVADEDAATLKQTSAQVFGEGVEATDRVDLVTKAGENVPSELTAAPITDEDGTIVGLTGTGRGLTERKKRERELERRTDLLERTQAIANVGGWEFDPVNDELRWTDETHRIHGVSLDYEPTLEEAVEFYHPEDVPVVEAAVERAIETGESFDEELRLIAADDTQRWVRAQGEPRRVDGETVLLRGVFQDITERIERERRYNAIFNQTFQFTGLMEPDGTLIEANETARRFGGVEPEDVIGEYIWDSYWWEISTEAQERVREAVPRAAEGEFVRYEEEVKSAESSAIIDFSIKPVTDEDGEVVLLIPEGRDITDRREHESFRQRLYETTADAEATTDETIQRVLELGCEYLDMESGFLTHIDDDTQRIVRANSPHEAIQPGGECPLSEAYCRKTIEMDEPLTVAHAGASGWEGDPAYERFGLEAYAGAKLTIEGDQYGTVCFADRSPRETEFSELERSFVDLVVRGIESTLERHKYETELERQNDQLGEFASVISHDLRNPLTVADGYLELACETGDGEYFTKVGNAHDRMDAIIEDVLTLTRQGERIAETSRVSLATVASDAWENVATADVELVMAEDLGEVDADEGRLKQLFENLYRNAVEHAGETITVRIGRYPAGFYVEDDGSGIPESEREKVFESGYTTGDEGTGMGLSIIKTIATAHGWGSGVEEGTEGGARFKIQLGMTRGGSNDLLFSN